MDNKENKQDNVEKETIEIPTLPPRIDTEQLLILNYVATTNINNKLDEIIKLIKQ